MTDKDRLEIIEEMRAIDPETGKPKHTQKEVAERLDLSRGRVAQLERENNLKPHQISYVQDNQEDSDSNQSGENGNQIRSENGGSEGESGTGTGTGMSEQESNESENDDEFVCTSCGNNTYHSANDYLNRFGDNLSQSQIQAVNNADKICASCGTTHP